VVTLALLSSSVVTSPGEHEIIEPVVQRRVSRRNPGVSPPFDWRSALALRPLARRARTMVSGAKGGRWPHDPQRSGLAPRSTVAAITVPVWPHLAQRTAHE
jgi:hypothetical protein